jgi:hypothetical protein
MKKITIAICLSFITSYTMAQFTRPDQNDNADVDTYGFNRQSLFVGGTIGVGASNYSFNAGATPEIGYTVKKWLDLGALVNINYYSERPDPTNFYNYNTRTRSFNYGVGAFARAYPINFLFVQVEPEVNFLSTNYKDYNTAPPSNYSIQATAPSLLVGAGYCQRIAGQSNFYIAVMFDALDSKYSPYRDAYTNTILPVFKAGFDIYLHPRG